MKGICIKMVLVIFLVSSIGLLFAQNVVQNQIGGRGGVVYHVFRSDDPVSPTLGTLRHALMQRGARTIVFDIDRPINLTRDIVVENDNVTVAGQTSPLGKIEINGFVINYNCDNVIRKNVFYVNRSTIEDVSGNISFEDVRRNDSNMNGIPDAAEIALFGRFVNGNGYDISVDCTNLEWYLDQLESKEIEQDNQVLKEKQSFSVVVDKGCFYIREITSASEEKRLTTSGF